MSFKRAPRSNKFSALSDTRVWKTKTKQKKNGPTGFTGFLFRGFRRIRLASYWVTYRALLAGLVQLHRADEAVEVGAGVLALDDRLQAGQQFHRVQRARLACTVMSLKAGTM